MKLVRALSAAVYGVYALILAMASGLVIGTLGVLPFALLPRGLRERYTMGAARLWALTVLKLVLWVQVRQTGAWQLPRGQGAIILCNHRSWLDPLVLMAHTRSNGLSKREILWIPIIGVYGYLTGAVFFDRRHVGARERARKDVLRLVGSGHRIQVFPEGTRTRDGRLREKVFLRLAWDAFDLGLPVVPCAVMDTERVLPPGVFGAFPGHRVRLHIGAPMHPGAYPDRKAFGHACWEVVRDRVAQLEGGEPAQAAAP